MTAVKRAFRSPSKDEDHKVCFPFSLSFLCSIIFPLLWVYLMITPSLFSPQKTEKRRWGFRRSTNLHDQVTHQTPSNPSSDAALAAAVATAEAAMVTAQAAVQVARLTTSTRPSNNARDHYAAILIQTAFRGYLVCLCY